MSDLDDFLAHYGIRGMKWGVRRSRAELAKTRAGHEPSSDASAARRTQAQVKKGGIGSVSNADLRALNERLNLEKNYKSLTSSKQKDGQSFVEKVVKGGKTMNDVYKFYNSPVGTAMRTQVTKLKGLAKAGTGKHRA